jgi:hypothetical protein
MKDSLKKTVFFIISTLKITYYNLSLLTSHFSLLTSYFLLFTFHFNAKMSLCVERYFF